MTGPLAGIRIVELGGIGPAPFCGMVLADLGAEVARVDRRAAGEPAAGSAYDVLSRSRRSIGIDLKHPDGIEVALRLVERSDALLEGFRPGVAERLGIGPGPCHARNRRLVYGRMTGWGQEGPLAQTAGHDLTYAAVAGAVAHIGRAGELPTPPLNLVADFGGGGMLLALGVVAALLHAARTGEGQVVDAAMVDGAALLMAPFFGAHAMGFWSDERGTNLLDSGAPFYDVYRCRDGLELAVAALEPQFYATLLEGLELDPSGLPEQHDRSRWHELRAALAARIGARDRAEWITVFDGTDACVAPVLPMGEVAAHPQIAARSTIVEVDGVPQPSPAPRFSATPTGSPTRAPAPGSDTDAVLAELGYPRGEISALRASGAVG